MNLFIAEAFTIFVLLTVNGNEGNHSYITKVRGRLFCNDTNPPSLHSRPAVTVFYSTGEDTWTHYHGEHPLNMSEETGKFVYELQKPWPVPGCEDMFVKNNFTIKLRFRACEYKETATVIYEPGHTKCRLGDIHLQPLD